MLFQYANVIFLVGAAWLPWALIAIERLLVRRSRGGLVGLGVVLALQVLGGDPEAAYLTVAAGGIYALVLAVPAPVVNWLRRGYKGVWIALAMGLVWVASVLTAGYLVALDPIENAPFPPPPHAAEAPDARLISGRTLVLLSWGLVGAGLLTRWRMIRERDRLAPAIGRLVAGCGLAMLLAAVQLVPAWEFSQVSHRAAVDATTGVFHFSVEPYRLIEAVWPQVFGLTGAMNESYFQALPPRGGHSLWTPSLYVGGLTLMLTLAAVGSGRIELETGGRDGAEPAPRWRGWLIALGIAGTIASFGRCAGPLWLARWVPGAEAWLGPHDPIGFNLREDRFLEDGWGSFYGMMVAALPGFGLFRYPGKLQIFAAVAVSGLAGLGWDRLASGARTRAARDLRRVRPRGDPGAGLARDGRAVLGHGVARQPSDSRYRVWPDRPLGGTGTDHAGARAWGRRAGPGTVVAVLGGEVALGRGTGAGLDDARSGRGRCPPDLDGSPVGVRRAVEGGGADRPGRAGRPLSGSVPGPSTTAVAPRGLRQVERAGAAGRAGELGARHPPARQRAALRPELQPDPGSARATRLHAVLPVPDDRGQADGRRVPGPARRDAVQLLPEALFDLWNARYFLLPIRTDNWASPERGYAAFLPGVEVVYPPADVIAGPAGEAWRERQDWQLLKNKEVFPGAWLVHFVRVRAPRQGMMTDLRSGDEKLELLKDLVYKADPFWNDPGRQPFDLRAMAFVETERPTDLAGYVERANVTPGEKVEIRRYEPQRVEIDTVLERPGLVILADIDYPGWTLTIDGTPAPIYRTNRLMRGAAVKAGRHTLVYTYDPLSFKLGMGGTGFGLILLAALVLRVRHQNQG